MFYLMLITPLAVLAFLVVMQLSEAPDPSHGQQNQALAGSALHAHVRPVRLPDESSADIGHPCDRTAQTNGACALEMPGPSASLRHA